MKRIITAMTAVILSSLFLLNVYANQVYVDGYKLNHTIEIDNSTYVQLRELSHYLGYEIEFDEANGIVNSYRQGDTIINASLQVNNSSSLFPVTVHELEFENHKEIIKVYELEPTDKPSGIPTEDFEKSGYLYTLTDITKSSDTSIDNREHTEIIEIITETQDTNEIISQIQEDLEFLSEDGYSGVLKLDISSINSEVEGYKNSSYTVTEKREYPNLSIPDTSLVPKTININGRTLNLSDVNWESTNNTTIDYEPLADTYTAIATYTGTATSSRATGYITTAEYSGVISKQLDGKTIYTAYFLGTPTDVEEPTIDELEQQLKDLKKQEGNNSIRRSPQSRVLIAIRLVLMAVLASTYFLLFRRNVKVFTLQDEQYKKIGKARVSKGKPIIDLTSFTDKVLTPSFILTLGNFTAKQLDGKTVTINYGDSSFQHIVTLEEGKKGYQIEVDF